MTLCYSYWISSHSYVTKTCSDKIGFFFSFQTPLSLLLVVWGHGSLWLFALLCCGEPLLSESRVGWVGHGGVTQGTLKTNWIQTWLHHFIQHWARYLTTLHLSFYICKIGIKIKHTSQGCYSASHEFISIMCLENRHHGSVYKISMPDCQVCEKDQPYTCLIL